MRLLPMSQLLSSVSSNPLMGPAWRGWEDRRRGHDSVWLGGHFQVVRVSQWGWRVRDGHAFALLHHGYLNYLKRARQLEARSGGSMDGDGALAHVKVAALCPH